MDTHTKPSPDIPKWSALLVEAVNKPGLIMEAYLAFHNYSIGNQILALVQCQMRGLEAGPINTFPGWQALGRNVKRGERALILCMPITRKARNQETTESDNENPERTFTSFVYKSRWFVVSQTIGDEFNPPRLPEWEAERALAALDIEQIAFTDTERTPKNLREVEAEAVALLCCEALNLEGPDYCRGYIQNWLYGRKGYDAEAIPEKSAQKIFRAADQILRAGRLQAEHETQPN